MINTSMAFKQAILGSRKYLYSAKIHLADGTELTVGNDDVMEGTVQFEQATSNMDSFDVGAATSNVHSLALNNMRDKFSQYDFVDAVIIPKVGLELDDGSVEYLQKGYYTVDEAKHNGSTISLSAMDDMVLLDRPYSESELQYPATLLRIYLDICTCCGVSAGNARFDHDDYVVSARPTDEAITFRDMLSYIGQITGYYAIMDTERKLCLKWYDLTAFDDSDGLDGGVFDPYNQTQYQTGDEADGGNFKDYSGGDAYEGGAFNAMEKYHHIYRLASQDIYTDDVVITGVKIAVTEETEDEKVTSSSELTFTAGNTGYMVHIENNPLITSGNAQGIANQLFLKIGGMHFRPLSVSALSDPSVEAGDAAYVSDSKGNSYATYLTSVSFAMGGYETYICSAQTPTEKNSIRYSETAKALAEAKKNTQQKITAYDLTIQRLTDLMAQTFGAFKSEQTDGATGATIYYMHNKPTLEESDKVWKMTADGFVVSTDGGRTWNAGMDASGNAAVNILSAIGIVADWIQAGVIQDKYGKSSWNLDTGDLNLSGTFCHRDSNGTKSVEITDNHVRVYDWKGGGEIVGEFGATFSNDAEDHEYMPKGSSGVAVWGDGTNWLGFGTSQDNGASVLLDMVMTHNADVPYVGGTASGTIELPGGTITVKNGLITGWDITVYNSGTITIGADGNKNKIKIKKGAVETWETYY